MINAIKTIVVAESGIAQVLSVLVDEDMTPSINKMESPNLVGDTTMFVLTCICTNPLKWRKVKKALAENDTMLFGWTK